MDGVLQTFLSLAHSLNTIQHDESEELHTRMTQAINGALGLAAGNSNFSNRG